MPEQAPPFQESKAKLRQQIDQNLKRVYAEAVEQDVPDRFKDLLARLRSSGSAQSGTAA